MDYQVFIMNTHDKGLAIQNLVKYLKKSIQKAFEMIYWFDTYMLNFVKHKKRQNYLLITNVR